MPDGVIIICTGMSIFTKKIEFVVVRNFEAKPAKRGDQHANGKSLGWQLWDICTGPCTTGNTEYMTLVHCTKAAEGTARSTIRSIRHK